jgi:hypothetical protein
VGVVEVGLAESAEADEQDKESWGHAGTHDTAQGRPNLRPR